MSYPRRLLVESGWRERTQSICVCFPEYRSDEFSWGGDGGEFDQRLLRNLKWSCLFEYLCPAMRRVHEGEWCFTAPPGPKPMLTISENVVSFKVFESMADETMFLQLATNTGERHWSVVGWILHVASLQVRCLGWGTCWRWLLGLGLAQWHTDYLDRLLSLGWGALRVSVFHSPFRIWKAIKAGHIASPGSSCVKTNWYWQLSRYKYCQLQHWRDDPCLWVEINQCCLYHEMI